MTRFLTVAEVERMNQRSASSRNYNRESRPALPLSQSDVSQWVDNDEGLYNRWKSSRQSKRAFVRENRAELTAAINRALGRA